MTSALEWGGGSWKSGRSKAARLGRLRENADRGRGGQNIGKFRERHKWKAPKAEGGE